MSEPVKRRRGHGDGSIHQRTRDGRWVAVLDIGWKDGKRSRKTYTGATRKEAADKLRAGQREKDNGAAPSTARQTVGQFLDQWLTDVVKSSVRPRTFNSYEMHVRLYLKPGLGHHQISKLTPQHVQKVMNDRLQAGLSPRSVQYMRAILRRALGQAVKWDIVSRNVATLVDPPKSERHESEWLSPDQARTFLSSVKGDRLEALYSVAVALGLRQGEALGLRWLDIDFDAATITVRKSLMRLDGKVILAEPKTRQSRRTIPLPASIAVTLREHRRRHLEERLLLGPDWKGFDGGDLVFTTATGTPLDPRNLSRQFKAALTRAGLPDMRWHDLRHSCASLLLARYVPPRVVMETLGHSQIGLTLNTYSHVIPSLQQDAAALMDGLLTGTP